MDWSDWGPALLTVVAGLALGAAWAGRGAGVPGPERRDELLARKEILLERLRDLDRPEEPSAEEQARRAALVAEAAELVRRADALPVERRASPLLLPLGLLALVGALTAWAVVAWPDGSDAVVGPYREASASPHAGGANAPRAELPDDLPSLQELAWKAILAGDLPAAMQANEKARAIAPDDPLVRTHRAALQLAVGMGDRADQTLTEVLAEHPDLPRALLWQGVARAGRGDAAGARASLERVRSLAPDSEEARAAAEVLAELDAPAP